VLRRRLSLPDLHRSQERLLTTVTVGWTCPPRATHERTFWLQYLEHCCIVLYVEHSTSIFRWRNSIFVFGAKVQGNGLEGAMINNCGTLGIFVLKWHVLMYFCALAKFSPKSLWEHQSS